MEQDRAGPPEAKRPGATSSYLESWVLLYPPPGLPRRVGYPVLAWLVIIMLVAFVVTLQMSRSEERQTTDSPATHALIQTQGRSLIGLHQLTGQPNPALLEQLRDLYQGTARLQLELVTLAGEVAGAREALAELNRAREWLRIHPNQTTATDRTIARLLGKLYRDYQSLQYDAPSLTTAEKEYLRRELQWYADLALAPAGAQVKTEGVAGAVGVTAQAALEHAGCPDPVAREQALEPVQRTALAMIALVVVALGLGLTGLAALVVFVSMAFSGKLRGGLRWTGRGGIYAETFAVWLLLFFVVNVGVGLLLERTGEAEGQDSSTRMLLTNLVTMLGSLGALAWPVLRGIPWKQVRQDIGLTGGRAGAGEPLVGLLCYAMSLPLILVGLIVTVLLMSVARMTLMPIAQTPGPAAHPIVEQIARADTLNIILIFLLASVVAPLVEEIAFRGILYRHLRESTQFLGNAGGFVAAALLVSFLFAVIHPQGLFGVPLLMSLAFGFAMAREWRVSLIPAMVAHGVSNGLVMSVCLLLFRV